ncbi:hypothetical protein R2601_24405 [Salipiger bermudensis HTCC2601]|uniref:DUF4760 domain-containing protein n=2 Tax=Salipiger TaxID=263377 RepID=Q0FHV7_SALBH|nr:hypothetical protein R2601_24405 [Salipiger bermudensis HTCC2601]
MRKAFVSASSVHRVENSVCKMLIFKMTFNSLEGIAMTEEQAAELIIAINTMIAKQSMDALGTGEIISGAAGVVAVLAFFLSIYFFIAQKDNAAREYAEMRAEQRSATAFKLHDEFFGEEMLKARDIADRFLMERTGVHFRELHYGPEGEYMNSVFRVTEFYERLSLHHKYERIEINLSTDLFASIFIYWWHNYLKSGTEEPNWETHGRLSLLDSEFKKKLGNDKYNKLKVRATAELIKNREMARASPRRIEGA